MKKTLFILSALAAAAFTAEASTVLVSFGTNTAGTQVTEGTYLGTSGQKVNNIAFTGSSTGSEMLVSTGGSGPGITLTTNGTCCGNAGVMTDASAEESALNHDNKFYDIFGQDMSLGNIMGGVLNANQSPMTLGMEGLSAGSYTLTILAGRGNAFEGAITTFSIGGEGISNISASLTDYSTSSNASLNGASVLANTNNGAWVVMTYTFDVTEANADLVINAAGGKGNINSLALTLVPEPASASLGLLGLGVLLMRRRRV